jgi:hypothetical protein
MPYITDEIKTFDKEVTKLAAAYRSRATPNNLYVIQQRIHTKEKKQSVKTAEELERDVGMNIS